MHLVETLFNPLEKGGVKYCLLRNHEFLDGDDLENDIDVLMLSQQRSKVDSLLNDIGFVKYRDEPTRHTYYLRLRPQKVDIDILHVCWDDVMYCTLPIANGDRILANRVRHDSKPVWIPSDEDLFIQLIFHSVLNRGFFKDKYAKKLIELAEAVDTAVVYDHATDMFGSTGTRTINAVFREDFEKALAMKWRLVFANAQHNKARVPRFLYVLLVYYQIVKPVKRFNSRYNPFSQTPTVALLGPDGSGKSTLSKLLVSDLTEMGINAGRVELGVYNDQTSFVSMLQRLNDLVVNYDHDVEKTARRQGALELDDRNSPLKSTINFVDQLYRYFRANANGHDILVADRYLHDVTLYHHPFFTRLATFIDNDRSLLCVLDADADVIAKRSEYDLASIEEMQERLSTVEGERIDVSRSISEIRTEILERISNSSFSRYFK